MNAKIVSLKPKPPAQPTLKTPTNIESNPAYSDKTAFPTIARKDDLPVKRKPALESGHDDRKRESAPIHIHREPAFTRRAHRETSVHPTTERTRPPRVSRYLESKFHALEKSQRNLIEQTKLQGQLEYLTVSKSSSGQYWITAEGTGKPFIRQAFESPEFCFDDPPTKPS